jgi:hypothetical protein
VSASDSVLDSKCPLLAGAEPGHCMACGQKLTGRQKRWCGREECRGFYGRNHWWTMARNTAIRRVTVYEPRRDVHPDAVWDLGNPLWTMCDQCGREIRSYTERDADGKYVRFVSDVPEVNHVEPRWGAGYGTGCWNHQTNLQVLCHECHVAETARQKRERIAGIYPGMPMRDDPAPFKSWKEAGEWIDSGVWRRSQPLTLKL